MSLALLGHTVAQLVEALCYKLEGHGFNSQWGQWDFSWTLYFWPRYGPGLTQPFNRNDYQRSYLEGKVGQCVGLTTLSPSCVDCLESCTFSFLLLNNKG
jgi:hypothetical protein